ncbi:dienelactone hydrolase family protein [Mangrovihabitans endophyticus]|uniref:Hydrolase n=1 Tax=Mangrovihabitans endophyticus TaxID=1751298 RepID=A0A8J3C3W2_9ACTN|nr:dienelactone hydrolase family protein [Mangrovihabitans endophyticus]GGL05594.1 hydrolase [Mangrovihabitans endophyticus]
MRSTTVDISTPDGTADAYLILPEGAGPNPAVLLFMDAFGLRPRLEEMAGRIADRGYAVLVPNLFYRAGRAPLVDLSGIDDPERRGTIFQKIMPQIQALDTAAIVRDAGAYLDYLQGLPDVADGPVAAVGYCMGGTNALKAMEAYPDRIATLASFHAGRVVGDAPDSPHRAVGQITGEVYFAHADNDSSMTPEHIAALESALREAGVTHTSEVYEGAPHGFTMSDTASHHEAGEQRHWERLFELLDRRMPVRAG